MEKKKLKNVETTICKQVFETYSQIQGLERSFGQREGGGGLVSAV